jgi:hypothetical protein
MPLDFHLPLFVTSLLLETDSGPSSHAHNERDQENDKEQEEEDFRNAGRCDRYTAESKDRSNERDYKENQCIVQHGTLLFCLFGRLVSSRIDELHAPCQSANH